MIVDVEKQAEVLVEPVELRGRHMDGPECDACGSAMQSMGHCKYLCRLCGFLRTCMDTV